MRGSDCAKLLTLLLLLVPMAVRAGPGSAQAQQGPRAGLPGCDPDNGGIELPPGFCAVVVADSLQRARDIVVDGDGDVYVTFSKRKVPTSLIGLRDTTGDGRADVIARFGDMAGNGVFLQGDHLYFTTEAKNRPPVRAWFPLYRPGTVRALAVLGVLALVCFVAWRRTRARGWLVVLGVLVVAGGVLVLNVGVRGIRQRAADREPLRDDVLRYTLPEDRLVPRGKPDTVVRGLPGGNFHSAKAVLVDGEDLYVTVGSRGNACQEEPFGKGAPGLDPCPELEDRAGLWRFGSDRLRQRFADGERFASGLRNTFALARHPGTGGLFAVPHGRDGLRWFPDVYSAEESAEAPSEEMHWLRKDRFYGWPYCFHDPAVGHQVLAPEYGGDGRTVGRCTESTEPVLTFPAHWAPMDMTFYTGDQFPDDYRGGAFVAFHGSSNRPPLPQEGYHVVFVPFDEAGMPAGYEVFASGFEGAVAQPGQADHRPSGVAVGPDGSLYVVEDQQGRVWRIVYRGEEEAAGLESGSTG